jgi:hypothetical protein
MPQPNDGNNDLGKMALHQGVKNARALAQAVHSMAKPSHQAESQAPHDAPTHANVRTRGHEPVWPGSEVLEYMPENERNTWEVIDENRRNPVCHDAALRPVD